MSPSPPEVDLAARDFAGVLERGLRRGEHLLTRGERLVAQRMRDLHEPALGLLARLTLRVGTVWAQDTLPPRATGVLLDAGLLSPLVSGSQRAEASTVAELKAGCRVLGLPVGGNRSTLLGRLSGQTGWSSRRYVRLCHPGLVHRIEQWAFLRRHPDRSAAVVQRLGIVTWPAYPLTAGSRLFTSRRQYRRWALRDATLDDVSVEQWLQWLGEPVLAPGRLSLRRPLARRVRHAARELERQREPEAAARLYRALSETGAVAMPRIACRHALALEASGQREDALRLLLQARSQATDGERLAIARTGRRLAKKLRRGWAPAPPLRQAPERTLVLNQLSADQARPRWGEEGEGALIEGAVRQHIEAADRRVLRGEGPLWRTLVTLLCTPFLFEPVAGQLPVPFLTAPLDWGTPAFASRRSARVGELLSALRQGEGAVRMARACDQWRGCVLQGVRWNHSDADLIALAEATPPRALAALCEHVMSRGRRATRGLPDLASVIGQESFRA